MLFLELLGSTEKSQKTVSTCWRYCRCIWIFSRDALVPKRAEQLCCLLQRKTGPGLKKLSDPMKRLSLMVVWERIIPGRHYPIRGQRFIAGPPINWNRSSVQNCRRNWRLWIEKRTRIRYKPFAIPAFRPTSSSAEAKESANNRRGRAVKTFILRHSHYFCWLIFSADSLIFWLKCKVALTRIAGKNGKIAIKGFHFSRPHNQVKSVCGVSTVSQIRIAIWCSSGGHCSLVSVNLSPC